MKKTGSQVDNIVAGFHSGENLVKLVEILSGKPMKVRPKLDPTLRIHMISNNKIALDAFKEQGIKLTNVSAEDIVNGSQKLILGLAWRLILKFQIHKNRLHL